MTSSRVRSGMVGSSRVVSRFRNVSVVIALINDTLDMVRESGDADGKDEDGP